MLHATWRLGPLIFTRSLRFMWLEIVSQVLKRMRLVLRWILMGQVLWLLGSMDQIVRRVLSWYRCLIVLCCFKKLLRHYLFWIGLSVVRTISTFINTYVWSRPALSLSSAIYSLAHHGYFVNLLPKSLCLWAILRSSLLFLFYFLLIVLAATLTNALICAIIILVGGACCC
jgi:hypothetical protein